MRQTTIILTAIVAALTTLSSCNNAPKDGHHRLVLLTTNDVHGRFFDSTYVDGGVKKSLMAIAQLVDSVRTAEGASNVVLVDAGDCLQGDNAAYYFNYVDTTVTHVYSRIVDDMDYDALAWCNHDVETGHPVYDRVFGEMKSAGVPLLAGNAIRNDNGQTYFPLYTTFRRAGLKVAVLGYTNANIRAWLDEEIWSGMHFDPIMDHVQQDVDMVRSKEKPDVVIVAMHSATGTGDGTVLEAEGLDVFSSVSGVDFVVCSHDHRPFITQNDTMALINSGSHCRYLGYGTLDVEVKGGKIVSRTFTVDNIPVNEHNVKAEMVAKYHPDYLKVKEFSNTVIGTLTTPLVTRDAYTGQCDYLNLIHTIGLEQSGADISFAAPLTFDGNVAPGTVIYEDLFTIYPYENQMYVLSLKGSEIKDYIESSYNDWIQTYNGKGNILLITNAADKRFNTTRWSFVNRSYNFDSAAGIHYTVDVTKPFGSRVNITSMASGAAFEPGREYNVVMTSYRSSGRQLQQGTGLSYDELLDRIVSRGGYYRDAVDTYFRTHGTVGHDTFSAPSVIGSWKFIPERIAAPALARDHALVFSD